jgi:5-methylcytosine-specific restriction endonuclease McrA
MVAQLDIQDKRLYHKAMENEDEPVVYPRYRVRPQCGSRSGYDYHRRIEYEEPCEDCVEAERQYHRDRRVRDRDKINHNRMLNRRNNPAINIRTSFTVDEITDLYGTACYHCKEPIDFTAPRLVGTIGWERAYHPDHLIPLSKGGLDTLENIRPSHAQCNIRKWATLKP